jgi:hypothetical protein
MSILIFLAAVVELLGAASTLVRFFLIVLFVSLPYSRLLDWQMRSEMDSDAVLPTERGLGPEYLGSV